MRESEVVAPVWLAGENGWKVYHENEDVFPIENGGLRMVDHESMNEDVCPIPLDNGHVPKFFRKGPKQPLDPAWKKIQPVLLHEQFSVFPWNGWSHEYEIPKSIFHGKMDFGEDAPNLSPLPQNIPYLPPPILPPKKKNLCFSGIFIDGSSFFYGGWVGGSRVESAGSLEAEVLSMEVCPLRIWKILLKIGASPRLTPCPTRWVCCSWEFGSAAGRDIPSISWF